ncbi:MAG TPA: GNAT family protein [Caulobacteraceae bacterium]|nr:GNAT family protein [Caulobacteraceae bacterium]
MALLDWITPENGLRLDGAGIVLRAPRVRDYEAWAALRHSSRAFLQPWEPIWPADDLERAAYRRRLAAYSREIDAGTAYPFFIFDSGQDRLAGAITVSNVRRGVAQSATVGYWIGQPYARQGLMTAALRTVSDFAFRGLGLHRLEAACVPQNEPSRRLLLKVGFEHEGQARAYLKINGVWRDHLLFGMISDAATGRKPV